MLKFILPLADSAQASSSGLWSIGLIVLMFGAFYFFAIRPQKKQEKQVKDMRDSLQVGDEITTIGGIIGKVISIKDETCMIETGRDRMKLRILKSAVRCVDVPNEAARAEYEAALKAKAEEEAAKKAELRPRTVSKKKKKNKEEKNDKEESVEDRFDNNNNNNNEQ